MRVAASSNLLSSFSPSPGGSGIEPKEAGHWSVEAVGERRMSSAKLRRNSFRTRAGHTDCGRCTGETCVLGTWGEFESTAVKPSENPSTKHSSRPTFRGLSRCSSDLACYSIDRSNVRAKIAHRNSPRTQRNRAIPCG